MHPLTVSHTEARQAGIRVGGVGVGGNVGADPRSQSLPGSLPGLCQVPCQVPVRPRGHGSTTVRLNCWRERWLYSVRMNFMKRLFMRRMQNGQLLQLLIIEQRVALRQDVAGCTKHALLSQTAH